MLTINNSIFWSIWLCYSWSKILLGSISGRNYKQEV